MLVNFSWSKLVQEISSRPDRLEILKQSLASHPVQSFEIDILGRFLSTISLNKEMMTLRVAIVSTSSSQRIGNAIRVATLKEGIYVELYESPYGSFQQEIISPDSRLYAFSPDLVVLDCSIDSFSQTPNSSMSKEEVDDSLAMIEKNLLEMWAIIRNRLNVPIIQHSMVEPAESYCGVAERFAFWSPSVFIQAVNSRIIGSAPSYVYWCDIDALSKKIGLKNWHDPRMLHYGKFGFSSKFLCEYAEIFRAALRQVLSLTPKALILDCDNTLWGGVIGDDGLKGIRLGPETAEGSAYQAFCRYLRELSNRGVILGICSKNESEAVREVFLKHPHMPLKLENISSLRVNWADKATNIREIALELNIDLSALVFVDDNPAECELIHQEIPQVRVVQMTGDPANFINLLDEQFLFHSSRPFSREDLTRSESYQGRAKTQELMRESLDLHGFLASLDMKGGIERVDQAHLSRLEQMEAKTNQFNLATRRNNADEIWNMASSPNHIVLAVTLQDRFVNHGLISYLAGEFINEEFRIYDWIMSCRVFARTVESFVINHLIKEVIARGGNCIVMKYIPTSKNGLMIKIFETLGFEKVETSGDYVFAINPASFQELNTSISFVP